MNASMQSGTPEYHGDDDLASGAIDDASFAGNTISDRIVNDHQGEVPTTGPEGGADLLAPEGGGDILDPSGDPEAGDAPEELSEERD